METIEIAQAVLKINELLEIVAKGQEIICIFDERNEHLWKTYTNLSILGRVQAS